ncbi:MAG: AbiH family protein [Flavobacteriales bacterium]
MKGRIIILGNGFDLAHGLKTSYKDLMEFLKSETDLERRNVGKCGTIHHQFKGKQNDYVSFKYVPNDREYKFTTCNKHKSFYFNKLFSDYNRYQKWVDLETLYFKLISSDNMSNQFIPTLNEEFDYLKLLLEDYLTNQIENKISDYNFDRNSFFERDNIFETIHPDTEKLIGIVNFNYTTSVVQSYTQFMYNKPKQLHNEFQNINVHGKLNSDENPIIFGYGDDNSEKYKSIQDVGNNELLVNFKTFQYLRNTNYKSVLSMLEMDTNIKIEIIGHSCGISDKTLLKTMFEHSHVKEIEYRYHTDEKYYFENLYNISRIFSDNVMMRKKVKDLKSTRLIPQRKIVMINEDELLNKL